MQRQRVCTILHSRRESLRERHIADLDVLKTYPWRDLHLWPPLRKHGSGPGGSAIGAIHSCKHPWRSRPLGCDCSRSDGERELVASSRAISWNSG